MRACCSVQPALQVPPSPVTPTLEVRWRPITGAASWLAASASATGLDNHHVTHYTRPVIRTFADKDTHDLYVTGRSRRLPPEIARRARWKHDYVDLATRLDDLMVPPGNRLHQLARDREGQHAMSINDQWRICFRFIAGDANDVEITDYH